MIDKILSLFNIESFERGANVFKKSPFPAVLFIMTILLLVSVGMNIQLLNSERDCVNSERDCEKVSRECEKRNSEYIQKVNQELKELYLNK